MEPQGGIGSNADNAAGIGGVIIFLLIVGILLNLLYAYLQGLHGQLGYNPVAAFLDFIRPYGIYTSLFFGTLIVYCLLRISQENRRENLFFEEQTRQALAEANVDVKNAKWERILAHMESSNENDWRLAILEADVLLEELLDTLGYRGETLGEKLKAVPRSDFSTLDRAWEAHLVRNRIAHEGADFVLSEYEARRTIRNFEQVFHEFNLI